MVALRPRTTSVLIYHGDDMETLAVLNRAVVRAERRVASAAEDVDEVKARRIPVDDSRYGDGDADTDETLAAREADLEEARGALAAADTEYEAEVVAAADRALDVQMATIGSKAFRQLVADHPARTVPDTDAEVPPTHPEDAKFGVNTLTFPRALLAFVHPEYDIRTITGPVEVTGRLDRFLDVEAAEGDFERMWTAAYWMNRSAGADPKAARSSITSPSGTST